MRSRETPGTTDETLRLQVMRNPQRQARRQPQQTAKPARQQPHEAGPTHRSPQPPRQPQPAHMPPQPTRQPQSARQPQMQQKQPMQFQSAEAATEARSATRPDLRQRRQQARMRAVVWCACVAIAVIAAYFLSGSAVARKVSAFLASFNFDQERVLLMTMLLMMLAGSAVAGVIFRQRLPAVVGGLLYFIAWYLGPFLVQVMHPPLGPGGLKQELIPGALASTTLTLLGVALVCASVGAAVGTAYGELVVTPLVALALQLWDRSRHHARGEAKPPLRVLPHTGVSLALGALLIYALILTSAVPGTLLTFGIEGSLYQLAPGANSANGEAHGTVLQESYNSAALGGVSRTFFVYLPPSYSLASAARYPVLYMLHGSPGTPHNWVGAGKVPITEDALVANGMMRETIIVSADGTGSIYAFSEWANSFDGRQRMEDAVALDLVHYIDQHYRTLPDAADRAIGGNSEGGFGAVNIALHHPEIFGAALSMGGYFNAEGSVFGYGRGSALYRAYNSPSAYISTASGARAARALHFVICVGTDDGVYYTDGITFEQQLLKAGIHVSLLKDSGGHSWELWALELGESLPLLEPLAHATGAHSP